MKEEKIKFLVTVDDEDFINNPNYSKENEYNEAICFEKTARFFDTLLSKNSDIMSKYFIYKNSNLYLLKQEIFKNMHNNDEIVKDNVKYVNITVVKNNKEIKFQDIKLSDVLIKYLTSKKYMSKLISLLSSFKKIRDDNEYKSNVIFPTTYKNSKEKAITNLLLTTTKKAYLVLITNSTDESKRKVVYDYLGVLNKYNVKMGRSVFEYGIEHKELTDFSKLNSLQILDIGQYAKAFDKILTNNNELHK